MVLYNQRARIFIGDEVTFLQGTQVTQNGVALQTGKVNVGVELNVTAIGNPDGTIQLKVNPEVGSLTLLETQTNGISLPRISRRTVQTSVRLKDGETLVIGGLIGENELNTIRKIPFLGDLPILGQLFRRDGREKSRSELVIILKATIQKP
jgi:type II secretory pathway component GspD/PulD (secretin)